MNKLVKKIEKILLADLEHNERVSKLFNLIVKEKEEYLDGFAVWLSVQKDYQDKTVMYALELYKTQLKNKV